MIQRGAAKILRSFSHSIPKATSTSTSTSVYQRSTFFNHVAVHKAATTTTTTTTTRQLSTAKLIQQLRKTTGAPMVECKKAISDPEVNGDFDKATDWLRKHGSAKMSSKLAGRDASEGLVGIAMNGNHNGNDACAVHVASIIRVSSETDFASRSSEFSDLVEIIAGAAVGVGGGEGDSSGSGENSGHVSMEELKKASNVQEKLENAIVAIRENLQITSASKITASNPNSVLTGYVHGKVFAEKSAGTAAAIVELLPLNDDKTREEITEIGKRLAMHIVAAKPEYLKPDDVPEDVIHKEKEILFEQMADSGKPKEILEKIVTGRLSKFYQGICLLEQSHMLEEGNPKVSKVLKEQGLELVTYKTLSI
jgi:elongation factor Ts